MLEEGRLEIPLSEARKPLYILLRPLIGEKAGRAL